MHKNWIFCWYEKSYIFWEVHMFPNKHLRNNCQISGHSWRGCSRGWSWNEHFWVLLPVCGPPLPGAPPSPSRRLANCILPGGNNLQGGIALPQMWENACLGEESFRAVTWVRRNGAVFDFLLRISWRHLSILAFNQSGAAVLRANCVYSATHQTFTEDPLWTRQYNAVLRQRKDAT